MGWVRYYSVDGVTLGDIYIASLATGVDLV